MHAKIEQTNNLQSASENLLQNTEAQTFYAISRLRSKFEVSSNEYQSPRERTRPFTTSDANIILDKLLDPSIYLNKTYHRLTGKALSKNMLKEIKSGTVSAENESL